MESASSVYYRKNKDKIDHTALELLSIAIEESKPDENGYITVVIEKMNFITATYLCYCGYILSGPHDKGYTVEMRRPWGSGINLKK